MRLAVLRAARAADVYSVTPDRQWREFEIEQQATIVNQWYQRRITTGDFESEVDRAFRYIKSNIRPGNWDANSDYIGYNQIPAKSVTTEVFGRLQTAGVAAPKNITTKVVGGFSKK